MKAVRQFGAFALILLWSLVPVAACAVPDGQMTASEHACCMQMHNDCGDMNRSSSQECCHQGAQADQAAAVQEANVSIDPSFATFTQLSVDSPLMAPQAVFVLVNLVDSSPPASATTAITVLRI